jgi:hypothetical protein
MLTNSKTPRTTLMIVVLIIASFLMAGCNNKMADQSYQGGWSIFKFWTWFDVSKAETIANAEADCAEQGMDLASIANNGKSWTCDITDTPTVIDPYLGWKPCAATDPEGFPLKSETYTQEQKACIYDMSAAPADDLATPEPGPTTGETCYFLGGRDEHELVFEVSESWLKDGAPLQQSWDMVAASGLEVFGDFNPETYEVANDGGAAQVLVCGDEAWVMPRETTADVPFWSISWIQKQGDEVTICEDDAGGPLQWIGLCAGNSEVISTHTSVSQLLMLSDFAHYANPLTAAMDSNVHPTKEQPLVLLQVFVKNAE